MTDEWKQQPLLDRIVANMIVVALFFVGPPLLVAWLWLRLVQ